MLSFFLGVNSGLVMATTGSFGLKTGSHAPITGRWIAYKCGLFQLQLLNGL